MVLHDWLCHSARNRRSFVIVGGKEQSVHGALGALSRRLSAELNLRSGVLGPVRPVAPDLNRDLVCEWPST